MPRARRSAAPTRIYSDHRILDARSLALHCLVVLKIERDPRLLDIARRNLSRWLERYDRPPQALTEWRALLAQPWPEIATVLTEMSDDAVRLRQSSPFPGVVTQAERRRIYEAFRPSSEVREVTSSSARIARDFAPARRRKK